MIFAGSMVLVVPIFISGEAVTGVIRLVREKHQALPGSILPVHP